MKKNQRLAVLFIVGLSFSGPARAADRFTCTSDDYLMQAQVDLAAGMVSIEKLHGDQRIPEAVLQGPECRLNLTPTLLMICTSPANRMFRLYSNHTAVWVGTARTTHLRCHD
jgi:hypothetical protein